MKIGIIGAGQIGQAFAKHAVTTDHEVIISNSRGADSLTDIIAQIGNGLKAGSVEEAAQADIILLALPWNQVESTVKNLSDWNGRIVLDATNAIAFPEFKPMNLGDTTSSEIIAKLIPGAHVIKAFNTLQAATLAADPHAGSGSRVIFYAGNDAVSKEKVKTLLTQMGFAGIDLGNLETGGKLQQFGGPLAAHNLIKLN